MIRIVFLIRSMERGGAERQLSLLARSLNRDRFDVTVMTLYSGGSLEKELVDSNIRIVSLRKSGRWDLVRCLGRLYNEVRRIRPHILHSYLTESNVLAIALKPLLPSTKVVWGIRASNMDLTQYDRFSRAAFRLQLCVARFADRIIFNSFAGRDYHQALGFPARKCAVIHGAVDTEAFKSDVSARKRMRETWGVDGATVVIALVARLDPMKDHPLFLKAALLVSRLHPDVRFACIGGGPKDYRLRLEGLTQAYGIAGKMIWTGEQEPMAEVYSAIDIACSASMSEGMPNAIAEAMACDVPCVVTAAGDSALLVGECACVVPSGDPVALAEALSRSVEMVVKGEALRPRHRVEQYFSVAQLVERTEEALEALLSLVAPEIPCKGDGREA